MTVTVYTKPGCQACHLTEVKLDRLGIEPEVANIYEDDMAMQYVTTSRFQQMPLVRVFDETTRVETQWSGFRPDLLDGLVS